MITNCPNCAAPLDENGCCEYCGTRTRYANKTEINMLKMGEIIDLSLVFKNGDENIVVPLRGCIEEVVHRIDTVSLRTGYDIPSPCSAIMGHEVKFSFSGYMTEGRVLKNERNGIQKRSWLWRQRNS